MMRYTKTDEALEEAAIIDLIRGFINLQSRDWVRRQQSRIIPQVLRLVDEARNRGDAVDVPALLGQVWLDGQLPLPQIEGGAE